MRNPQPIGNHVDSVTDAGTVKYTMGHMIPSQSFRGFKEGSRNANALHATSNVFISGLYLTEQCEEMKRLNMNKDTKFDGNLWNLFEEAFAEFRSTRIVGGQIKILTLTGVSMDPLLFDGKPVSIHINTAERLTHPNSDIFKDPYKCLTSTTRQGVQGSKEFSSVDINCLNHYLPVQARQTSNSADLFLQSIRRRITVPERVWKMVYFSSLNRSTQKRYIDDVMAVSCANKGLFSEQDVRCKWENIENIESLTSMEFKTVKKGLSAEETVCNFVDQFPPIVPSYKKWFYNPKSKLFDLKGLFVPCKMGFKNENEFFEHWLPRILNLEDNSVSLLEDYSTFYGKPVYITSSGGTFLTGDSNGTGVIWRAAAVTASLWIIRSHNMISHFSTGKQLTIGVQGVTLVAKNYQNWDEQKWLMLPNDFVISFNNNVVRLGGTPMPLAKATSINNSILYQNVFQQDWASFFQWHLSSNRLSVFEVLEFIHYSVLIREVDLSSRSSPGFQFDQNFYDNINNIFDKVAVDDKLGIILCFAFLPSSTRSVASVNPNLKPIFLTPNVPDDIVLHMFIPYMKYISKWVSYLRLEYLFNSKQRPKKGTYNWSPAKDDEAKVFSALLKSYLFNNYYFFVEEYKQASSRSKNLSNTFHSLYDNVMKGQYIHNDAKNFLETTLKVSNNKYIDNLFPRYFTDKHDTMKLFITILHEIVRNVSDKIQKITDANEKQKIHNSFNNSVKSMLSDYTFQPLFSKLNTLLVLVNDWEDCFKISHFYCAIKHLYLDFGIKYVDKVIEDKIKNGMTQLNLPKHYKCGI
ncbi:hypothetical protein ROZALSC1DRAFT_30339 [Rozella allomycis CSF55]|uniref:Uncharacterized protein n=1 Tax=Rozella allomycis (strain CSF55) TaxID=988480 RepID=A0A075B0F3_ROZAC|nr:hypothetical protein O9G_005685 [Rozella allomycis CSF55]RKP17899.1 hypothetical protein ROZALSC1DRAFT_30339 [Rozella allomycis CSF55]|eukprot:EPZ36001.1 hypothetical protein O9G_005685 [Rozella allomycis CSF55]